MDDFDPRTGNSADIVSYAQATGRNSAERSDAEYRVVDARSTEVIPKKKKRRFPAAVKLRILAAADQCTKHGEIGALLRREGLYSTQITNWRLLRDQGELGALTDKKRGRKSASANPLTAKLAESEKRNAVLTKKLERAEEIIHFQKKFAEMFGKIITLPEDIEKM